MAQACRHWLRQCQGPWPRPARRSRSSCQAERRLPQAADDYAQWFGSRLKSVDRALADGREWLCAGRFTGADISVGYALLLARTLDLDQRWSDAVQTYWERLAARPGFAQAKAAQSRGA